MIRQLALHLPHIEHRRRADFIVSPATALALDSLDDWPNWPEGKLVLIGPTGTGKSHLAAIWAEETGAVALEARDLRRADIPALLQARAVVIENAEELAGDRAGEEALFYLHNLLLPQGRLLITAQTPPRDWGLALPDLLSRLQAAPLARISPPDDELLAGVLQKLFADRQLHVPSTLIPWLIARMPRSIAGARALVARLDELALERALPLSPKLAAEILQTFPEE